jgi:hypothetical protein
MSPRRIRVSAFQPFKGRVGVDTVLGLEFPYDPDLVELLKESIRDAKRRTGVAGTAGGWLAEHHRWFVERAAWPLIKAALLRAGHAVDESALMSPPPQPVAPKPAPPQPKPQPPECPRCRKTAALLEEWAWQMSTRWSDGAGPVIEAGLELLREMLGVDSPTPD